MFGYFTIDQKADQIKPRDDQERHCNHEGGDFVYAESSETKSDCDADYKCGEHREYERSLPNWWGWSPPVERPNVPVDARLGCVHTSWFRAGFLKIGSQRHVQPIHDPN